MELARLVVRGATSFADIRVRAGFLMALGIGQLITRESLQEVASPVEVRWGRSRGQLQPPARPTRTGIAQLDRLSSSRN